MGKVDICNALAVIAEEAFFQDKSFKMNEQLYYDSRLEEIINYLNTFSYRENKSIISEKYLMKATKAFFEEYVPLKDVPTIKDGVVVFASPFDVMVNFDFKHTGGLCYTNRAQINGVDRRISYLITLKEQPNLITIPIYAHELTHTQVDKNVETLENFFNKEVLSIFIEKVCSYHTGEFMFSEMELFRLCDLRYCLDRYLNYKDKKMSDRYKNRTYVDGTLKASHLFDIYYNGNEYLRKEILKDVGKVFNEEMTVENLLHQYGIYLNSSKDIKYLKRKH